LQESDPQHLLLEELKQLYAQIGSQIIQNRTHAFGERTQSSIGVDIYTPLHNQCEQLASTTGDSRGEEQIKEEPWSGKERRKRSRTPFGEKGVYSLSDYFRITKSGMAEQMLLAQRLEDSAWIHVRSALRYARQGNTISANLHSELANNAVVLVAHYMSDKDFNAFIRNLEHVIKPSDTPQ
jgi:hypothetical protein